MLSPQLEKCLKSHWGELGGLKSQGQVQCLSFCLLSEDQDGALNYCPSIRLSVYHHSLHCDDNGLTIWNCKKATLAPS